MRLHAPLARLCRVVVSLVALAIPAAESATAAPTVSVIGVFHVVHADFRNEGRDADRYMIRSHGRILWVRFSPALSERQADRLSGRVVTLSGERRAGAIAHARLAHTRGLLPMAAAAAPRPDVVGTRNVA